MVIVLPNRGMAETAFSSLPGMGITARSETADTKEGP